MSRIQKGLQEGRFLTASDTRGVYLGANLAEKLQVGLGDELVFISTAMDRSMAADTLEVIGLFKTHFFDSDAQFAFVNKPFMDQAFLAEQVASYLVGQPKVIDEAAALADQLNAVLTHPEVNAVSWRELLSGFVQFMDMDEAMGRISIMIVVLVVFFVIMIFQFISIHGRTREIGMMRAMGTSTPVIIFTLVLESVLVLLLSLGLGIAIGAGLSLYFEANPITLNFSEEVMEMYEQFGMVDMTMPARFSGGAILFGSVTVSIMMLSALVFPIWRTLRLQPRDALGGHDI